MQKNEQRQELGMNSLLKGLISGFLKTFVVKI